MNVLCIMAHPDDEVLGCGGTLAKHAESGDSVKVVILCVDNQEPEVAAALEALDVRLVRVEDLPDQRLDTLGLSTIIEICRDPGDDPDVVYTHHPGDLNQDHALTARAVLTAFRPKPGEKPRTILACEVLSSTEWTFPQVFQPNWFVALTGGQLTKKWSAFNMYESEIQPWPHPRNRLGIEHLAHYRGMQSGTYQAEAFQLLRHGPA